jgi:hypothetical protein
MADNENKNLLGWVLALVAVAALFVSTLPESGKVSWFTYMLSGAFVKTLSTLIMLIAIFGYVWSYTRQLRRIGRANLRELQKETKTAVEAASEASMRAATAIQMIKELQAKISK